MLVDIQAIQAFLSILAQHFEDKSIVTVLIQSLVVTTRFLNLITLAAEVFHGLDAKNFTFLNTEELELTVQTVEPLTRNENNPFLWVMFML